MTEIGRLLIDLQKTRREGETIALGLRVKNGDPVFAVLVVRGSQLVDVLGTGATPEEACRASLEDFTAAALS